MKLGIPAPILPVFRPAPSATAVSTRPAAALPSDPAYVDDVPWLRRVAWPQVLTLGGIALAVLAPMVVVLLLAA